MSLQYFSHPASCIYLHSERRGGGCSSNSYQKPTIGPFALRNKQPLHVCAVCIYLETPFPLFDLTLDA
ncbi:hypothetical protein BDP27DRAFT_1322157 [Rhodocollybia butyracea]|uniref:Uncharacterized protein n=1 Tax=Rhodocollybia butyracea TaxID=206335 RepID=A0A9P5UAU7_9AGAR|nr:hypothetical protein BDP27DRAFT_1322157 [Rhodocollybia butyracea]